jgi:hypothetical protein
MTELASTDVFPQPHFPYRAYGVDMAWVGEDGGMAACGHVPDLRFVAACNHLARKEAGLRNIWDDPSATLEETLGDVIRVWAVPADPAKYASDWAVTWHGVTEHTPGAFPLTVLWP